MKTKAGKPKDIDDYISGFNPDVQAILEKIRQTIRKSTPKAEEAISYQIPTFKLFGQYLIYFAAFKKHVSIYPAPRAVDEFKQELSTYEGGKGTVQFPLDKPIPLGLIKRIVKFRAKQIAEKSTSTRRDQ